MRFGFASGGAMVCGVVSLLAFGCASQPADTQTAEPASLGAVDFEKAEGAGERVLIQVEADCKVDVEEAHISESKKEEAHWQLNGDSGPLVIEFKEQKGRDALDVSSPTPTTATARIKLAKQQGRHPYRIKIGEKECPDPVLIIDG